MTENKKPPPAAVGAKSVKRRDFLKKAGVTAAAAAGVTAAGAVKAPYVYAATNPIKWRLQTYSGAPLGAHVIKPQIEAFNRAAYGQMEIELYYADQLVPTGELFRSMQNGVIDAVQSDDATMASPVDINVFGGYFPFSTRYSLDMPVLFRYYGLDKIWAEAYGEVKNVEWLSACRRRASFFRATA
ncbi:MAG: twin-arginine translocation signal domain-containing protein [Rhodospirillales bacterium]